MTQLQQKALAYLPPAIRAFIEGSSRRELLKKINCTLLLFGDSLIHIESGRLEKLVGEQSLADPSSLAGAARRLLDGQSKESSILLLLPPAEFIATTQSMPGVNRDSLISALKLQIDNILPAYEQALALAVNPASVELGDQHIALWIPQQRMSALFGAFHAEGLFIAAIKPRTLNLSDTQTRRLLLDRDSRDTAALVLNHGVVERWLLLSNIDLEQAEFAAQWEQELSADPALEPAEYDSEEVFCRQMDSNSGQEYSFFPDGALNARKRVEKGKRMLLAAAAVAGLAVLASIPFLLQSLEFRRAAASLAANREMSVEARQDQAVVANFEREWGVIDDFPQQDVRQALYTLQNVLSPEQVTSSEISEGLIRIQGTSNDPQAILQRLEQDPLFTEVAFSRATNNTRYYIDLRLATVNFEAYMVRYFPDE